ncbi:hypothetical protein [Phormidesmis priestleyi]|nr:hypothetical protein [Phormidesmis priestleyi]
MKPDNSSLEVSRGIESIDINIVLILVKADVEEVAQALTQLKPWDGWIPNAYGQSVPSNEGTLIFKLRGHSWSYVCQPFGHTHPMRLSEADALSLSDLLSAAVIDYVGSNTGGWFRYLFCNQGRLDERLRFEEYDRDGNLEFQSQRGFTAKDIKDAYTFTLNFIREQDAYIPALKMRYSALKVQQVTLHIENLMPTEIERMDYLYKTLS